MIEIFPYLYRTDPIPLFPFSSFKTNAYLLIRPEGNFLVYGPGKNISTYYDFIGSKGGIKKVLMSHRDEASKNCTTIAERFDAQVYCPKLEEEEISRKCHVDKTFSGDQKMDDTFEIIFTPGHSPGSSCFLWKAPDGKGILFTGDNLIPREKRVWGVYIMDKNNIPATIKSMQNLRSLKVDVIVPGGYSDTMPYEEVTIKRWKQIIDDVIERLKAGEMT